MLKGKIGFNEFANRAVILGKLPWPCKIGDDWSDADDAGLRNYMESVYGITHANKIDDALKITFQKNTFHPVREYLESLSWDGQKRVETLLIDYLGAEDTEYVRLVTKNGCAELWLESSNQELNLIICLSLQANKVSGKVPSSVY